MTEKQDGGPAVPTPSGHAMIELPAPHGVGTYTRTVEICTTGMSLRDWFAGMAAGSIFHALTTATIEMADGGKVKHSDVANLAYGIADAMIAERAKGGPRP